MHPKYADGREQISMTEEMLKQGYYGEMEDSFFFRVTQEQYEELTKSFLQAKEEAKENLKEVTYTYEELFGETLL